RPPTSTLFPYTTLFRSAAVEHAHAPVEVRRQPFLRDHELGPFEKRFQHVVQLLARYDLGHAAGKRAVGKLDDAGQVQRGDDLRRSEEHTSELQSLAYLV